MDVPSPARPYPSEINVSGLETNITDVTLILRGFTHTYPDDVDMLLVGPQGQNAIVMSDAGNGFPVRRVTLVLNDFPAIPPLPDESQITSDRFQPANYGGDDVFASPAPTPSGGSALSVFNNTNPNGTWELYVMDDENQDKGRLSGWQLVIEATTP